MRFSKLDTKGQILALVRVIYLIPVIPCCNLLRGVAEKLF